MSNDDLFPLCVFGVGVLCIFGGLILNEFTTQPRTLLFGKFSTNPLIMLCTGIVLTSASVYIYLKSTEKS